MAGRILPAQPQRKPVAPEPLPAPPRRRFKPIPTWRTGDRVRWHGYRGFYLRETVDDQAEVLIGTRIHRLPKAELRPA